MNSNIVQTVTRKGSVATVHPDRYNVVQRAAENLSRRNVDQSITELLNEALSRLVVLCYERDDDGQLCNIDSATGRLLVPLPWGRGGYSKWGLSASESDAMRAIMFTRQTRGLPLFFYERSRRTWFVNLKDYPDGAVVISQLKEWEIALSEYREARAKAI